MGINLSHTTAMKLFCDYSHISLEIKNDKITKWKKTSILENTVHWGALIVSWSSRVILQERERPYRFDVYMLTLWVDYKRNVKQDITLVFSVQNRSSDTIQKSYFICHEKELCDYSTLTINFPSFLNFTDLTINFMSHCFAIRELEFLYKMSILRP